MSKHTPGPWEVGKTYSIGVWPEFYRTAVWHSSDDYMIAEARGRSLQENTSELRANARLIAAAPVLLEGLKDVFRLMDEGFLVRSIEDDGAPDWALRMLKPVARLKTAFDAIKKATGEE